MPRKYAKASKLTCWSLVVLVWIAATLRGQTAQSGGSRSALAIGSGDLPKPCPAPAYDQDAPEQALSTTDMTAGVRGGYRLFRAKCGQCHSLNQQPTKAESSVQDWTNMVYRMGDMPSAHMSDSQAKAIVKFVVWEAEYSNEMVKTLMGFDSNRDGQISKSEMPERMRGLFDRADTNRDGFLSPEEIKKFSETQGSTVVAARGDCDPEEQLKK